MHRLVVATFAVWAGCGDNLAPTVAYDDFEAARIEARCTYLVRCGLFETIERCQAHTRLVIDRDLDAAVTAEAVRYDGANAKRCLDAIAAASCDQTSREARIMEACDAMFVGTQDDGASCAMDEQCRSGACDIPSCMDECCAGTCAPSATASAAGELCARHRDCADDGYCGTDQLCHELSPVGGSCRRDLECAFGAACIGAGIDPGTCRALPLLGESCPYLRCAELGALCSPAQRCVVSGPGAPCASDAECSVYGLCELTSSTCGAVPTLDMECATRCAGESWCDRSITPPRCVAPRANGELCTTGDQCASRSCEEGPAFDACGEPVLCL